MLERAQKMLSILSLAVVIGCGADPADPAPQPGDSGAVDAALPDVPAAQDTSGDAADAPELPAPDLPETAQPHPTTLQAGAHASLRVIDGRLELYQDDELRLAFSADRFELGMVPALDDALAYDPYYLEEGAELAGMAVIIEDLTWQKGVALTVAEVSEAALTLELGLQNGQAATLTFEVTGDGRISGHLQPAPEGPPAVFFRLRPQVDAEEGFYGLGETFDRVEHRGMLRAMQFETSNLESAYNEVHVPVPLLIGTRGWGIFVESMRLGVFGVATEADDEVKITFGQGAAWQEGLDFHLFAAAHPLDITKHYYEVTGYPGKVAPWALGPLIWRDEVDGQVAVEGDLDTIRELDLATTGYWIDRPYASAVNSFDFEPKDYANPEAMIQKAQAMGFEMGLWHTPYVEPDDPDSAPLYEHAVAEGYFPPVIGAKAKWGPPIDYTNPDAVSWFQEQLAWYAELGIRGYKLDYAEEIIPSWFGVRTPWSFFDGSDELTMHRQAQLLYHRMYAEMLPEEGGFLLCRAGAYGDQANGVIIWPGDIDSNMAKHGEEVTEKDGNTYIAVGGLPAAVVAGSGLGPSGFPFFGSDTGGYRHAPPDKETYVRWFEHTALSPVMQVGTNAKYLPWKLGHGDTFDPEVVDLYRLYARLHLRLFPTFWTMVQELPQTGRALQRPLGLAHPELGQHPSDIYLLGDHLLVAPVTEPGVTSRTVPLPGGTWVDWWTGETHEGGADAVLAAPLGVIPLLVRAGAPIALLRDTIDTLSPVTGPQATDSFATSPNPLHVRLAPGAAGAMAVYDGTSVTQAPEAGVIRLEHTAGSVFDSGLVIELFGQPAPPISVTDLDGAPVGEVADAADFAAASEGWRHVPGERGGMVLVKLAGAAPGALITPAQ